MSNFLVDLYNLPPTVSYCEKAIGHFIQRPFYSISDLAFILVGLYILFFTKKSKAGKIFGAVSVLVGLCSLIYDATYSYLFQLFDVAGMYILVTMLIFLNLKRMGLEIAKIYRWLLIVIGLTLFYFFKGEAGNIIFGLFVISAIVSEWLVNEKISRHDWIMGIILFILGFAIWIPDAMQTICDPNNIFNGRGIFHLFEAGAVYFMYRHYAKIR